ncbi:MAG TPA: cytochrome c peroxidase [Phenylobacterium sp.]|jgi:cytochrome c peroxidase|uniref:cytochrome-c peroxidase n=1 Tax=Phenylobacterium sp. TaxID=1871053 RepID=UPI002D3A570C|nr:cytochrome c peroxidase [Phenylobacterium sp.]HZZ69847.1 cytochrome c peroxidase [Phenylobacterium sp.]
MKALALAGWGAVVGAAFVGLAALAAPAAYRWDLPKGVAPPPVPADNPMTLAKVELGHRLFYDADLSIDGTLACAGCHGQHRAFSESNATHPGVRGNAGRRNVMTLSNVGYYGVLTWGDPRLKTLEAQVLVPTTGEHPIEMGMKGQEAELERRLGADACYRKMFAQAFPERKGAIGMDTVALALAAFERTLISFRSDYDHQSLSAPAKRGEQLFFGPRFACASCHTAPLFTDAGAADPLAAFHRIEPANGSDQGLAEITGKPEDAGRFRTPSLRNVALSPPYLHDGSAKTLPAAIRRHEHADAMTDAEMADLVAFLDGLTDRAFVTDPRFALPKTRCGKPL